jgi:hypothetical protein
MQRFWICTAVMLSLLFAAYSIVPALAGPGTFVAPGCTPTVIVGGWFALAKIPARREEIRPIVFAD